MPRDGNGVATKPAGTTATPNTLIESSKFNSVIDDIYALLNAALPITAGGTSAVSKQGAVSALFDGTTIVDDDDFTLAANGDQTKLLSFDLSGQTTALTRTQKTPNYNGTLASQAVGTAIASAASIDLGAASGSTVHVTGTTTITALGTADAGIEKTVIFDGILTLTHNGTSLILPGAANITTAAGDTAVFVSEGSGNWRCLHYHRAATVPVRSQLWEHISTTAISSAADWKAINLSAYRMLRIKGYAIGAVDGGTLSLRTSSNNGSSYDSGASDYTYLADYGVGPSTPQTSGSTAASSINVGLTGAVGSDTGEGVNFEILVFEFNQPRYARFISQALAYNTSGGAIIGTTGAIRVSNTARDAIALFFASGNIATGFLTLEGVRG